MSNPNVVEQLGDSSGGNDLRDSANEEGLLACSPEDRPAGDAATIKELDCILTEKAAVQSVELRIAHNLFFEMVYDPVDAPMRFSYDLIVTILETVKEIFKTESPLVECDPAITVVGDLHGSWKDLLYLFLVANQTVPNGKELYNTAHIAPRSFLFLGNYVDYGNQSLKVLMFLFSMKISQQKMGKKVIMLRGNHETRSMNYKHGFRDELLSKFDKWMADDLFDKFNDVFNHMPLACLIAGQNYLCMHGGISPKLTSLDDIRRIPKPLECVEDNELACDLLWADFKTGVDGFEPNEDREISVYFGEETLATTLKPLGMQAILRSHQKMRNGFKQQGRSLTITSFMDPEKNNIAAMAHVPPDLTALPNLLGWASVCNPLDSDEEHAWKKAEAKKQDEEEGHKVQDSDVEKEGGEFAVEVVDE